MNKRQLGITAAIIACAFALSRCISKPTPPADPRGEQYAAANTCASCHQSVYDAYTQTAHAHTSALATAGTVKGDFNAPGNVFHFSNGTEVVLEKKGERLVQRTNGQEQPFDIVIGSGRKAQTSLYWQNGQYFQLPISWFVPANSWANSPGFPADHPKFDRVIPSTCFGCHSSMIGIAEVKQENLQLKETFEHNKLLAGIDCQRCHGPAAEHVDYHNQHPQEKTAHAMKHPGKLSRQQQLDMCALCHSGLKPMQRSAFDFKPGDALSEFLMPTAPFPSKQVDVHGNQYQLLTASKCFSGSQQMTCGSCHDPHTSERSNMQVFSQRCMSCHQPDSPQFCKLRSKPSATLQQNCIDCHMPAQPSTAITLLTNGQQSPTADSIRTHMIAVY
ncbi:multiheme c-type cytochrome [Chitinophaga horti]|uniref:Multiheme c-type cytochrome n=1 Tax=Chitinophaga horti TaxID=2920382 RepID=A0ABY6J7G1_9BACT|nr:multiheme c-type cytochrome [Chitinophaga horti]UYQ95425.1 multiheme c-type cytochrome [Chitinophaga horti]